MDALIQALKKLESIAALPGRPFICSGFPSACKIAIVGINPASATPFWKFWDNDRGFNRKLWLDSYQGKKSRSRSAIERLIAQIPSSVIEVNLYTTSSRRLAHLPKFAHVTTSCDLILEAVRPSIIVLAGATVGKVLAGRDFPWKPKIIQTPHFIYWGKDFEKQLAQSINIELEAILESLPAQTVDMASPKES